MSASLQLQDSWRLGDATWWKPYVISISKNPTAWQKAENSYLTDVLKTIAEMWLPPPEQQHQHSITFTWKRIR